MTATRVATAVTAAAEAIKEQLGPAREVLEENVRQAQRAVVRGRHAAEDLAHVTTVRVRRHPLRATVASAAMGALAGFVVGLVIGRLTDSQS